MKRIHILILISILSIYHVNSQAKGILTYTGTTDLKLMHQANSFDADADPEMQMTTLNNIINSSEELTFELKFNNGVSEFKCIDLPEQKESITPFLDYTVFNLEATKKYYSNKNTDVKGYISRSFDKYLVEPELTKWVMDNEEKIINGYNCKKATIAKLSYGRSGIIIDNITAWYTTDIPVNYGIQNFEGLPGVIVELSSFRNQYVNYKLNLKQISFTDDVGNIDMPNIELISEKAFQEMISGERFK